MCHFSSWVINFINLQLLDLFWWSNYLWIVCLDYQVSHGAKELLSKKQFLGKNMMIFGNLYTIQEVCLPTLAIRGRFSRLKDVTKQKEFHMLGRYSSLCFPVLLKCVQTLQRAFLKSPLVFNNSSNTLLIWLLLSNQNPSL